jgi:hypothetical protein
MTDSLAAKKQRVLASIDAGTAGFRKHFKREPDDTEDFSFIDGYATALRDAQANELPASRRKFAALPLGTRFRYVGHPGVYVKLDGHKLGLVAKWEGAQAQAVSQQILSAVDTLEEAKTLEVEVVEHGFAPVPVPALG